MDKVHIRQATPAGNGAHIPVPKPWVGNEIVAVPANEVTILVRNNSISKDPPGLGLEPEPGKTYQGFFQNHYGEQMVFEYPGSRKTAEVRHGDMDWDSLQIMRFKGGLHAVGGSRSLTLREEEWAWVRLCLKAAGLEERDLPEWEPSTPEGVASAMLSGDKKTQIAFLEGLLRQLKES